MTQGASARRWADVRPPPERRTFTIPTPDWSVIAVWVIAVFPVVVQSRRLQHLPESVMMVIRWSALLAVATALVCRIGPRAARVRGPLMVLGGLFVGALVVRDPAFPRVVALFVVGEVVGWSVATGRVAVPWSRWPAPASFRLAVVPLVASWEALVGQTGVRIPLACLAAVAPALLVGLVFPGLSARAMSWSDGIVERGAAVAATLVTRLDEGATLAVRSLRRLGSALAGAVMVVVVLPVTAAWAVHGLLRSDPLAARHGTGAPGQWSIRRGDDATPFRAGGSVPFDPPDRARRARRSTLTVSLAIAAVVVLLPVIGAGGRQVLSFVQSIGGATSRFWDDGRDPVTAEQPGSATLAREIGEFSSGARFDAVTTYTFADYDGRVVREVDGERAGWRPPECECERLTVWWFGGSAAWGWSQRGDHSLPSQFAKAAWGAGIALDVRNFAMPGWSLGQSARWFAHLATSTERDDLPDLAVFYDGANDLNLQRFRNERGRGTDDSAVSFGEVEIGELLWTAQGRPDLGPPPTITGPELTPGEVADVAMGRYVREQRLAGDLAEHLGVAVEFVWQPLAATAPRGAVNENLPDEELAEWREMVPTARRQLPEEVVDLSNALDDVDEPVFGDMWHTNEIGADAVARRLFDRLESQLVRLAAPR